MKYSSRISGKQYFVEVNLTSIDAIESAFHLKTMNSLRKTNKEDMITIGIKYYLRKNNKQILISDCSSGEIQLFKILSYILINIADNCSILIDEPENSLHPIWQYQYIKYLRDLVYLYNPNIYIATHSSIILSGLYSDENIPEPVEQILYNLFNIITPKNNYFNSKISNLLDDFANNKLSDNKLKENLRLIKDSAMDIKQQEIIDQICEKLNDNTKF